MGIEFLPFQVLVAREAHFEPELSPPSHLYLDTEVDVVSIASTPKVANPQPGSSGLKMKGLPQRPGPSGSRVTKKKVTVPRLGDGLLGIFTEDASITTRLVFGRKLHYHLITNSLVARPSWHSPQLMRLQH